AKFQKQWAATLAEAAKTAPTATSAATATTAAKAAAAQSLVAAANDLLTALDKFLSGVKLAGSAKANQNVAFTVAYNALLNAPNAEVESRWLDYMMEVLPLYRAASIEAHQQTDSTEQFLQALARYQFEQNDLVSSIATKPVLAFEYTHNSPLGKKAT